MIDFSRDPSVTFLIGGLGAGKTELSINLAVAHALKHGLDSVDLLDLDIVNPFFRVRKIRDDLKKHGVNVVVPDARVVNGDLPALPAAVWGALENPSRVIISDVGGGELGLRPLARLREYARQRQARTYFVINPFRPGFRSLEEMEESFKRMCAVATLQVTHLVANPHLVHETTPEIFWKGFDLVSRFSGKIGHPIAFAMALENLVPEIREKCSAPIFPIRRFWPLRLDGSDPEPSETTNDSRVVRHLFSETHPQEKAEKL